ncbi:MAG: hypothetical protein WCJ01_02825 [Ignavibacteria bacterium]
MNIKVKVILSVISVLLVSTIVLIIIANQNYTNSLTFLGEETLHGAQQAFMQLEQSDVKMLSAVSVALTTNDELLKAYAERKRDRFYELAGPIYDTLKNRYGITHWNLIDTPPSSVIFARLSKPELFNDTVRRITYINSVRTGNVTFGKEVGKTGFVLRTITPVVYKNAIIGYQEIGEDIDKFFRLIKKQTNSDVALIVDKKFMNHKEWESTRSSKKLADNWSDFKDNLIVSSTFDNVSILPMDIRVAEVPVQGKILGVFDQNNSVYQRSIFPVKDASLKTVGCIMIVQDITKTAGEMRSSRIQLIVLIIVLSIVLCTIIILLLQRLVFSRLNHMINTITRVVGGDVNYKVKEDDEIGRFEAQIVEILRNLIT